MAIATPKAWLSTSYTPNTWTAVVSELSVITSIIVANNSIGDVIFTLKHGDSIIIPATILEAGTPYSIDFRSLVVTSTAYLYFSCDLAGVHISISGASYAS